MNKTRRLSVFLGFITLVIVAVAPLPVGAFEVKNQDSFIVQKEETIKDNVYAVANNIKVEGVIDGDLICLAGDVAIKGKINGDLICLAKKINVGGEINGDLRTAAGEFASISGKVKKNANVITKKMSMADLSSVGGSLLLYAGESFIDGRIDKNLEGSVYSADISGHISGDVDLDIRKTAKNKPIAIKDQAYIGGSVNYRSPSKKGVSISDEAYINERVNYKKTEEKKKKNPFDAGWFFSTSLWLLIALLLVKISAKKLNALNEIISEKPAKSLSKGAICTLLTALAIIVLSLTIIGIPLAVLATAAWLLIMMSARLISGIWLGQRIFEAVNIKKGGLFLSSVGGIVILKLLIAIPFIGWAISLLSSLWGIGAVWILLKQGKKGGRKKGGRKKGVKTEKKKGGRKKGVKTKTKKKT